MKLSIVIVNYNVEYFLEQCLHSVKVAMTGIETEVFVVDNNSVDGSVAMVKEKFPWVSLIANTENLGFSRANNQAMRISKGEYILLLNPDTVIQEDTLRSVLGFMDAHPDAGGLGVKMVDGKGNYLPESKRGLPTPAVAFCKIFGLSALFPRSARFNRYHLGHLNKDEIQRVEILSGAFMLMRKAALDKVGLLDEAFFMYGEDIDLSWRIIQGGYQNYYYPDTRIIHYKGESTKKGSLNYVFVFYNAMIIFARKHFSQERARLFSFLINLAIYLRAALAVGVRTVKRIALPMLDAIVIGGGLYGTKEWYESYSGISYPDQLWIWGFSAYCAIWIFTTWLSGGYDRPLSLWRTARGVVFGSVLILIGYALLPEDLRFSRALVLLGSAVTLSGLILNRFVLSLLFPGQMSLAIRRSKRFGIVGSEPEVDRVRTLLAQTQVDTAFAMPISPENVLKPHREDVAGQLEEIIRVHRLDEVVFCAKDLSAQDIISLMTDGGERRIDYKIAPPESLYLIGSNSIDTAGDLFVLDVNSVSKPMNRRLKRLLDVVFSLVLTLTLPLNVWFVKRKIGLLGNLFLVLIGMRSWVGYRKSGSGPRLPFLKPGVLDPLSPFPDEERAEPETIDRLNMVYAKDYRPGNDISILLSAFGKLGDTPSTAR